MNTRMKISLIALILSVFSVQGFGENPDVQPRVLTLDEALELAGNNNPDLVAARRNLESAARSNSGKWNSFLPNLSLNGSYTNSHNPDTNKWNWGGSTGASLSLDFGIPFEMRLKSAEYEAALVSYKSLEASTLSKVATDFYSLIAEKNNLEILAQSEKLAENLYNQNLANYNRGLTSELDLLQSKYSYLSIRPEIDNAKSTYEANLDSFKLSIGVNEPIELSGEMEVTEVILPETDVLIEEYTQKSLSVQEKIINLEKAKLSKTQGTTSALAPTFNLSENLSFSEGTNGNKIDVNGSFTASVSIPLTGFIPYSETNLTLKNLDDQIASAEDELEQTITETENSLSLLPDKISRLWNSLDLAQMNYEIAQRAYQLSLDGYNSGLVAQTDMETARQQMISANQAILETKNQYTSALYEAALLMNISIEEMILEYGGDSNGQ